MGIAGIAAEGIAVVGIVAVGIVEGIAVGTVVGIVEDTFDMVGIVVGIVVGIAAVVAFQNQVLSLQYEFDLSFQDPTIRRTNIVLYNLNQSILTSLPLSKLFNGNDACPLPKLDYFVFEILTIDHLYQFQDPSHIQILK